MYSTESMTMTKKDEENIRTFEQKLLRRINGSNQGYR